ncbi:hypothetical protein C5167_044445 [Papaver somniferum]|uniref:Uncharacterized protein n=1 Tax=Papaver somniferum TaxID=3469 RepID=A0A4Y7LA21_PAPSO|nr:hypothetical protein C5167_044445 [Papaver somniferum]
MIKLKRKWMKSRREDDGRFSIPTQDDSLPIETHQQEELVRSFEQKQTQQSRLWRGVFSTLLIGYVVFMVFSIYQQASFPWELDGLLCVQQLGRLSQSSIEPLGTCPVVCASKIVRMGYLFVQQLGRLGRLSQSSIEPLGTIPVVCASKLTGWIIFRYHGYFMGEIDSRMVIAADWIAVLTCLLAVKGLFHNSKANRQWLIYSCFTGLLVAAFWLYHMLSLSKFRWDIIWLPLGPLSGAGLSLYIDHLLNESSEEIRKLRAYMYSYKAT